MSTKAATTPSVSIERPDDISELVGDICCKGYDLLKYRLAEIVKDTNNEFWFQKDTNYTYVFDESSLPNGGIYGMKDRRGENSDLTLKLTVSKLVPLKCASDFERNVTSVAAVKYRLGGRRKVRKPAEYTIELCVVLVKEKVKRVRSIGSAPASTVVCTNMGDGTVTATSLSGSGEGLSSLKRKAAPLPFTFKTTKLCISLYAPIETQQKVASVTTGVPSGKTNKEFTYDLSGFIVGGIDKAASNGSSEVLGDDDEVADESFDVSFTLSRFRKDLMVLAGDGFPEEYGYDKKTLGPRCKLFIQKQYNSSSWTEIPSTIMLVRTILEQMETKGRVKNGRMLTRFSFGRSKAGLEFGSVREVNDYVCDDFGEYVKFSQNETPASPYVRKVGKVKRDSNWNKPARITELIANLYSSQTSKLHYGFLKEHGNSFFRIISANLSMHLDNSVFLPALNDPDNHPISDEIITQDVLEVFIRSHQNDLPGNPMPETNRYPPTNETMLITPPTLREWKSTQQPVFDIFGSSTITPTNTHHHAAVMPSTVPNPNEIDAVTFRAEWNDEEVSVMIEDNFTIDTDMESILDAEDVLSDLGAVDGGGQSYRYVIQKRSGGKLTLKWDKFRGTTMKKIMNIKNVHEDYIVIVKKRNL